MWRGFWRRPKIHSTFKMSAVDEIAAIKTTLTKKTDYNSVTNKIISMCSKVMEGETAGFKKGIKIR